MDMQKLRDSSSKRILLASQDHLPFDIFNQVICNPKSPLVNIVAESED